MSGEFRVVLRRISPACPACSAPRDVRTRVGAGTVITPTCSPYRCRIARVIQYAGALRRTGFEVLPADDTQQGRRTA